MASSETVAKALAILSEDRGGDITAMRLEAWYVALSDVPDAAVLRAVGVFLRTDTGNFLPPVAKIRALAAPNPTIDTDALLAQIAKMGEYNPNVGWIYPRIDAVRERFGDAVAQAYVDAGASRCFADNDRDGASVTRDIARRSFRSALTESANLDADALHRLAGVPMSDVLRLSDGSGGVR